MSAKKKAAGGKVAKKRAKPAKAAKTRAKVAKRAKSAKSHAERGPSKASLAAGKARKKPSAKRTPTANVKKSVATKKSAGAKKSGGAKKLVAKKQRAAAAAPSRARKQNPKPAAIKRRDGAGHLDPTYAAELRALSSESPKDDERAFPGDALSEELGEEFVETVTSGEDEGNEIRDQRVTEELGGPFTVTTGGTEFAGDVDESNPEGATREPFPRT